MLPVVVGCLLMLLNVVHAVLLGMMTSDVTSCVGMSANAEGCSMPCVAWHDMMTLDVTSCSGLHANALGCSSTLLTITYYLEDTIMQRKCK